MVVTRTAAPDCSMPRCLAGLSTVDDLRRPAQMVPQIVVFLDADYSDDPGMLRALVAPIFEGTADFVLGSRLLGKREPGAMPPQSVFGNRLACFLMHWLFGIRYTDLGPFRAIDYRRLIELGMTDRNFGWTVEMQIKAARRGLRTIEIPVPYRCRIGQSKISGTVWGSIRAGYKILYLIAMHGFFRGSSRGPAN